MAFAIVRVPSLTEVPLTVTSTVLSADITPRSTGLRSVHPFFRGERTEANMSLGLNLTCFVVYFRVVGQVSCPRMEAQSSGTMEGERSRPHTEG